MIRTLTFSSLYPNSVMPGHGVFVENRLRHLLGSNEIETDVVAPVPWFPLTNRRFGAYADFARVPAHEQRHGIDVYHPRYPLLPKIGMSSAPWFMAIAMRRLLRRLIEQGRDFDLIDSHYFYPDGVAATLLGGWLQKPVIITARGCDLNFIPQYFVPRRWIEWASNRSSGIITVSEALKNRMIELGANPAKVRVLRNGVDLACFRCATDREELRHTHGLRRRTLLSVGRITEPKGQHLIIEAMPELPDFDLLIVGDGEWREKLAGRVKEMGLSDRIRFLGSMKQSKLVEYYQVADALILASRREGMANVLLESLACGTPLIATAVGGNPEVLADQRAGVLMEERSSAAIVESVKRLFSDYPDRTEVRAYARTFDWGPTTQGQLSLFREALGMQP